MKVRLTKLLLLVGVVALSGVGARAQISLSHDYKNYNSAAIGTFQGINFKEAGFSGMFPVPGTGGKEFWICTDRGVNIDAASANPSACRPTYDKIYAFPTYAPKIFRVRVNGDSVQILQTITMKRPDGSGATGLINPTGFGSTASEEPSTDTVQDCANFTSRRATKDIWGIDAEGLAVDRDGNYWVCEEGGPTIWKLSQNGVVLKRYTPYAGLTGAQPADVAIDTIFKYRKNNRGFEGITITPNGMVYAIIQSPLLYPSTSVGEATRIHRILEINPTTGATRMFAYLNDGVIGASGSNQIRLKDWKLGDMAAINDTTFLVMEAALRGTSQRQRIYQISLNGATTVTGGLYSGVTLEALVDSAGLAANSITPVRKSLFLDLLTNGWDSTLDKAEGLAIINDSTIAIANDNDYGQYSPGETGVAVPTGKLSHVVFYSLSGSNRLTNFVAPVTTLSSGVSGISSSQTPYLVPSASGVVFTSVLSAGDTTTGGYRMAGTPDGAGAFDNGDGTFTMLVNHEFVNTAGATRAHGSTGAFVSKWTINKANMQVMGGSDLMRSVTLWNTATSSYVTYNASFPSTTAAINRFCSGDLPAVSAFYNAATGKGTPNRIFMNGEEAGSEGRAFGHVVTGSDSGKTFELPYLGKFSWENALASPLASDTTVVIGTDDATPGQVYVYVGTKQTTGNDVDKAGLNNGTLYGVAVSGLSAESSSSIPSAGTSFSLVSLGDVHNLTGSTLNTNSNTAGVTTFLRPEDGSWDPANPNDFYFATTNSFTSPSRLWKLHFTNAANPMLGGTITAVLDGTEGQKMFDNLTIDNYGHVLLLEDVGNNAHIGKVWQYTIATDSLVQIGGHDTTRFLNGGANFLTQDEESSGIIDMERILGPGMFMLVDQAHYSISGDVVEGGQILKLYNPASFNSAPEIAVKGNSLSITDGDATPTTADNTNFGTTYVSSSITKSFVVRNTGAGSLTLSGISFSGTRASEYRLAGSTSFPRTVATNDTFAFSVTFTPMGSGARNATINIASNDVDENNYDFALTGNGVDTPEVSVWGNGANIIDGDLTPGVANNTDFGTSTLSSSVNKTFVIKNTGHGNLLVSGITFTGTAAADFNLVTTSLPDTIAMGDSLAFTVRFAPLAIGTRSAMINIANSDADESTFDFAIQGTGAGNPEINVQGNSINITDGDVTPGISNNTDFGYVNVGSTVTRSFTIQNSGAGPLSVTAFNFSGPHASDFTLSSSVSFPISIAGGAAQPLSVVFAPSAAGARIATIAILCNDADEATYDFSIMGNGVSTTGITELSNVNAVGVSPNPGADLVNVTMDVTRAQEITVSVLDLTGKEVVPSVTKNAQVGSLAVQLNTTSLPSGVYLVKVTNGTGTYKTRLVVSH